MLFVQIRTMFPGRRPPEASKLPWGEKASAVTPLVCHDAVPGRKPCKIPLVDQNVIFCSTESPPAASVKPSGDHASAITPFVVAGIVLSNSPLMICQILMVGSNGPPPDANLPLSGENARLLT